MAVSKNAKRGEKVALISRWGGGISMKSTFENGKIKHFAVCDKSGNKARKPKDLM